MARWAKLMMVGGKRGTGKTNTTLDLLYEAVRKGRKALIFDPNDEFGAYSYRPDQPVHCIKTIFLKDIPRFTAQHHPEIRRIRPYWDDSTRMSTDDMLTALARILSIYRDGILLIEDINKYLSDNPTRDIVGALATLRQAHVDLILHFQLVGKIGHPKLMGMANYIRLHKTMDEVTRHAEKFGDKTEVLTIAQTIVNARFKYGVDNNVKDKTGQYFSCTIDLDDFRIKGIFTEEEAESAIADYISRNSRNTINSLLNSKDRTGKAIWKNYGSAYSYLESNMKADYFGKFD